MSSKLFTHVSDPNGHPLIQEVEDHYDDKVDAGSRDRSCELRSNESAHKLDLPQRVFDDTCKGSVHSQSVRDDPDDTGHYQTNLCREVQEDNTIIEVLYM